MISWQVLSTIYVHNTTWHLFLSSWTKQKAWQKATRSWWPPASSTCHASKNAWHSGQCHSHRHSSSLSSSSHSSSSSSLLSSSLDGYTQKEISHLSLHIDLLNPEEEGEDKAWDPIQKHLNSLPPCLLTLFRCHCNSHDSMRLHRACQSQPSPWHSRNPPQQMSWNDDLSHKTIKDFG